LITIIIINYWQQNICISTHFMG